MLKKAGYWLSEGTWDLNSIFSHGIMQFLCIYLDIFVNVNKQRRSKYHTFI